MHSHEKKAKKKTRFELAPGKEGEPRTTYEDSFAQKRILFLRDELWQLLAPKSKDGADGESSANSTTTSLCRAAHLLEHAPL